MTVPIWIAFILLIICLVALDLGVFHRRDRVVTLRSALGWSSLWISMAMLFMVFVYFLYRCFKHRAVGLELDVPFARIAEGLAAFRGVDRRLQKRGQALGATVLDDYGHHPTEIAATVAR